MGCRLKANQPIYTYIHIYIFIVETSWLRFTLSLCLRYLCKRSECALICVCVCVFGRRSRRESIHVLLRRALIYRHLQEKTKCVPQANIQQAAGTSGRQPEQPSATATTTMPLASSVAIHPKHHHHTSSSQALSWDALPTHLFHKTMTLSAAVDRNSSTIWTNNGSVCAYVRGIKALTSYIHNR